MTTNYADKIVGALQRPGRIDRIIKFGSFGPKEIKRLICSTIPVEFLDAEIDWQAVATACQKYTPAFVSEVGTGAALAAVSRSDRKVTGEMLIKSANNLRGQLEACERTMGFKA